MQLTTGGKVSSSSMLRNHRVEEEIRCLESNLTFLSEREREKENRLDNDGNKDGRRGNR